MSLAGAPWVLQRIQATRDLAIDMSPSQSIENLELIDLHQTLRAMIGPSQRFDNLTTLVRNCLTLPCTMPTCIPFPVMPYIHAPQDPRSKHVTPCS